MQKQNKKILVWLSGGVDSAVSAYLLKKQWYEVHCGFMINYLDEENENCTTKIDLAEAKKVAEFLELPFFTFDYRDEYESRIIDYIYREYEAGRTPNPDVFCNNLVKFDLFLEEAISLGYDAIATGHYAQKIEKNSKFFIKKWIDPNKDQSYFLSRLSEFQISKAIFPIGHLEKSEVREIAKNANLPNANRKDSQGLCFIGKIPMKEFLSKKLEKKPGKIVDLNGKVLGEHDWAFSYTIGQRKWIKIGGWPALFVIAKDTISNTITVWTESDLALFSSKCEVFDYIGHKLEEWKKYSSKIRYRQEDQECEIKKISPNELEIIFTNPQRAIASGQICVIYDENLVIWSAIIK